MQIKKQHLARLAVLAIAVSGSAQAALIDRGSGLLYDDVLDITWLQDANYAFTSGYAAANAVNNGGSATDNIEANGRMGWTAANTWAADLVFAGYDDWRLPTMTDTGASGCDFANSGTDCGYNVDTDFSEMAHMYHNNLGLTSRLDASGAIQADFGVFGNGTYNGTDTSSFGEKDFALVQNLQASVYWSGVPYAPNPSIAWAFGSGNGYQGNGTQDVELYAWAVRAGDVTAGQNVPAPAPLGLIASGLMAIVGWRRKR